MSSADPRGHMIEIQALCDQWAFITNRASHGHVITVYILHSQVLKESMMSLAVKSQVTVT